MKNYDESNEKQWKNPIYDKVPPYPPVVKLEKEETKESSYFFNSSAAAFSSTAMPMFTGAVQSKCGTEQNFDLDQRGSILHWMIFSILPNSSRDGAYGMEFE